MWNNKKTENSKRKLAWTAVLVGALLVLFTTVFVNDVKEQLWEKSISTIMESTMQGCNALKLQIRNTMESMQQMSVNMVKFTREQYEELKTDIEDFTQGPGYTTVYLKESSGLPELKDQKVWEFLMETNLEKGIINPHISSVSGINVFDVFVSFYLKDGAKGFFVEEYEVGSIVDSFSVSFYNNTGFSYVINTAGDVLIRSPHPNSNKTVQNLFDMLKSPSNNPESIEAFAQALQESRTGYAVFRYQDESTVFGYAPIGMDSDWYLISIIPELVVNAQTSEILGQALTLIGCILLGITLLVLLYFWNAVKANKKLRNQMEYTNHLYNAIPEAVVLITAQYPYHILQLNWQGLNLFGFNHDESDAVPDLDLKDLIHPEDYKGMVQLLSSLPKAHKGILENRMVKADCSYFWADGIVEQTLDENGNPVIIAAFHDITSQKLAEEAEERVQMQERLTLVGAIANAYPVIITMNLTRDQLSFIYVKPGLMIHLGEQKTFTQLFYDMLPTIHPDYLEEFQKRFCYENLTRILGQEKKEVSFNMQQMLSDGNYHWISTQVICVDNPYSEDKLAVLISRRIDEQQHEEERQRQVLQSALDNARAANEAKSQFLSNMSHDIRTPMNVIVGMAEIAADHLDDRERVAGCLNKIYLSSKHLLSLINDILDMSKIESGKLSLREEAFNYAQLVMEVVELMRPEANEKGIMLEVSLGVLKNENVIGDSLHIRQVFLNILSNAVKYTRESGSIRIDIRQDDSAHKGYQNFVFVCADTGIGMSEAFLQRLFEPFERASDSTTSKVVGTGLGLAITKNLVELMNGEILADSSPDNGSVFTVTLPLRIEEALAEEVSSDWAGLPTLVIDDDRQTCEDAVEILNSMGLCAQFVTDGAAAIQAVETANETESPYRLILLDWKIPDMDGIEITSRIRRLGGPEIPIIIFTAYDWSDIEEQAKEAGATAFLSKPFYRSKFCYLLNSMREEPETTETGAIPDYSNKRLLLVEDNELNREIATILIGQNGIQIDEAWDGEEALKKVAESAEGYYDIILMDIQMPKMDGYQATQAIRGLNRKDVETLPIIAMTANAFEEDVRAALRAGMNAHLSKPIDTQLLVQMLYKYLL